MNDPYGVLTDKIRLDWTTAMAQDVFRCQTLSVRIESVVMGHVRDLLPRFAQS